MAQEIAKKYTSRLDEIKKKVETAREYFSDNVDRFNQFRSFVFETTLTDDDITNLQDLNKPILEFNILEPYISRLCGEFAKQMPDIEVNASHDAPIPADVQTVNIVEGLLRFILTDSENEGHTKEVYKDLMSGGFSVFEVDTEYVPGTFHQVFKLKRIFDPTMVGFDPMAQLPHKGDGDYCYKLYPKSKEDFKAEYPDVDVERLKYSRSLGGFSWSFQNEKLNKIILLCEYYEKKKKAVKLVHLSNDMVMTDKQYKMLLELYKERGILAVPPTVINQRWESRTTICRYTFIEDQVLDYEETELEDFPIIFVDGNSIKLRKDKDGDMMQMTRPYLYHARDIQRLKNFAGQTLANELENLVQHKFKVAEEAIPAAYAEAYQNVQQADVLVYKAFKDDNPEQPLPPPQEIVRTPIPPEISNTFSMTDQMTQNILGSFDIQMGNLNKSQLSGLAIQESVSQSNAVAMPYVEGYLQALTQVANIIVKMIPKYMKTPRTMPIVKADNKRDYVRVNDQNSPQSVSLGYCDNALNVNVKAGVNFSVQKVRALQQIIGMMQASPLFAQFMNTEGLPILLDNLEIRGIDQLKLLAEQFTQKMKSQPPQPNPVMMKMQLEQQKLSTQAQQNQAQNQLRAAEIAQTSRANDIDAAKVVLEAQQAGNENAVQLTKAKAETYSKAVDMALKVGDQHHQHTMDVTNQAHTHTKEAIELAHQIYQAQQPETDNDTATT